MVSAQGFEPRTHALEGRCSIQLSYAPTFFTQSGADEGSRTPTPKALDPKSSASANSATSAYFFLGGGWWIRTTESTANRFTVCPLWPLGKSSIFGAGNRTRTYNLLITSQLLYQLSHTSLLRGYVLLSQAVAHQVPLPLKSLTSVFGMGTGVSSLL